MTDPRESEARRMRLLGSTWDEITNKVHVGDRLLGKWLSDIDEDPVEKHIRSMAQRKKSAISKGKRINLGELIAEARSLNKNYKQISEEFRISKGSIHYWCKKLGLEKPIYGLTDGMPNWKLGIIKARKQRNINREWYLEEEVSRLRYKLKDPTFVAGLAWYMAEGSKRSATTCFTNQDPNVILFMHDFFKTNFPQGKIKYKITVNYTRWEEREFIKSEWSKILNQQVFGVYKKVDKLYDFGKHGTLGRRRRGRDYIGVCKQFIQGKNSTRIRLVIARLWNEFAKKTVL